MMLAAEGQLGAVNEQRLNVMKKTPSDLRPFFHHGGQSVGRDVRQYTWGQSHTLVRRYVDTQQSCDADDPMNAKQSELRDIDIGSPPQRDETRLDESDALEPRSLVLQDGPRIET